MPWHRVGFKVLGRHAHHQYSSLFHGWVGAGCGGLQIIVLIHEAVNRVLNQAGMERQGNLRII